MHISKEFLMEAFGLSLLVALLLISVQIFHRTTRLTDLMKDEQEQQILALEEQDIVQYDGMYVDGMAVIGYIKNMVNNYDVPVKVLTEQHSFVVEENGLYAELRNAESEYYINPLALYYCEVVRDSNEVIKEIQITVKGGEH